MSDVTGKYMEMLMSAHNQLYRYIYSLTGKVDQAEDILQETNLKLWQLRDEFDHSRDFLPWACKVAYNQVRAARKKIQRERLVFQDDEVLHTIAMDQIERMSQADDRSEALEVCIDKLPPKHKSLVDKYYRSGFTMEEVGMALDKSSGTIAVALHRIRTALAECIKERMA